MNFFLCRLCRASIASGSAVYLFSQTAVHQNLPGRITDLLDVPIAAEDGLPQHICNICKRKLGRLEKAAEELEDFRTQASSNHTILASTRPELKRTKETSASVGVSPDTAKGKPASKKPLLQSNLDFEHSKTEVTVMYSCVYV